MVMFVSDLDNEIREHVYELIEGRLTPDEFETWFVSRTWDERTPLVAEITLLLAEKSLLREHEFVDELKSLVATIRVVDSPTVTTMGSTAKTLRAIEIHVGTQTIRRRLEFAGK